MSVAEATPETDPLAPWRNRVHCGDCLEVLRAMPDNSVDSCVTDPPYGLSEHKPEEVAACLAAWVAGEAYAPQNKRGFMGKAWDAWPPGPEVWREVYRVLKPGAFCLVFAGTRTQDLMGIALRLAGFEIRDSVVWHYGNGFPKSLSLGKAIDKAAGAGRQTVGRAPRSYPDSERWGDPLMARAGGSKSPTSFLGTPHDDIPGRDITAPATDLAREWEGWGTALKPSHEPIIVAMKPCDGTFAANAAKWGVAGLNVDGCRVGTEPAFVERPGQKSIGGLLNNVADQRVTTGGAGRWPPNTVFSHAPGCRLVGAKRVKAETGKRCQGAQGAGARQQWGLKGTGENVGYGDADGLETVQAWECVDGCPVAELDRQSGDRPAGSWVRTDGMRPFSNCGEPTRGVQREGATDTGGASRFFPQFDAEPGFMYCAKASRREREAGCEGMRMSPPRPGGSKFGECTIFNGENGDEEWRAKNPSNPTRNHHPTVKPFALMRWLCRLTRTPRGGIVLDPFAGSGTTCCAALLEDRNFVGIEREAEYVAIAEARVAHWTKEARKLAPSLAGPAAIIQTGAAHATPAHPPGLRPRR